MVPQGIAYIAQRVPALIEDAENELPGSSRLLIHRLLDYQLLPQANQDHEVACRRLNCSCSFCLTVCEIFWHENLPG